MKDIWFVIFSIGLAQGLFLILILLLLKGKRRISIYVLVILLLCFMSLILAEWLKTLFSIEQVPFTFRTGETIPLLIGPLFLIYITSVVQSDFRFHKRLLLHFAPFVIFLLLFSPFYLKSTEFKIQYIISLNGKPTPTGLALFSFFKGLHSMVYFVLSLIYLRRNSSAKKKRIRQWFNVKLLTQLIWLQLIAVTIIYFIVGLEYFYPDIEIESDRISSLIITFSFFVLASVIVLFPKSLIPEETTLLKKNRYMSSSLGKEEKQVILNKLQTLLATKKPHLDPELTRSALSEMIGVSSNQLSQVINELLHKNFHQLINEYRVEEVKRHINDPSRTLLGIALDSGFNSKSAFNRIFKEITGTTPSEYKKLQ